MKFLANENFPLASVNILKSSGYDVISIGVDNPAISDEEVLNIARSENRIILTFDRDYGELIFKYGLKPNAGVIYLRLKIFTPEYPSQIINELISKKEIILENTLTVLTETQIRQRKF